MIFFLLKSEHFDMNVFHMGSLLVINVHNYSILN